MADDEARAGAARPVYRRRDLRAADEPAGDTDCMMLAAPDAALMRQVAPHTAQGCHDIGWGSLRLQEIADASS